MVDETDTEKTPEIPGEEPGEERTGVVRFLHDLEIMRGAIIVIAVGVIVAFMSFARVILVPIVLAAFLSYVLNPPVEALSSLRIPNTDLRLPRVMSVTLVVFLSALLTGALGFLLGDQVRQLGAELPRYSAQIAEDIGQIRTKVLELEDRFEKAVEPIRGQPGERETPEPEPETETPGHDPPFSEDEGNEALLEQKPIVVRPGSNLWTSLSPYLAGGLTGLVGYGIQGMTLVFVLFFILLQAPTFKKKLLKIVGTTDERRAAAIDALEDINEGVQRYLFGKFIINAGLAVAIALAFFVYGVKYALLLGILGGLLNFIPYFGAVIGMFIAAIVAYMQFGTLYPTAMTAFIYFLLTSIEGNLITPIALGHQLQLNSLAVMLGLIFWGWLWGAIGMLLAIPILAVSRVVAEHVPELESVAELLRE